MRGRGPGETASELLARQLDGRLADLRGVLAKLKQSAGAQRKSREQCARIALVGYTNAGKTSLMNGLTEAGLSARDRPFETLETTSRSLARHGGDIIIMVHPDYQYTPKLIPAMTSMIGNGLYSCVLGSRILGGHALKGGMPIWTYIANRFLTFTENFLTGAKLSEYHTGYRAFSRICDGFANG